MNKLSSNIALKEAVKGILSDVELKIPQLFSSKEKLMFDTFLFQTGLDSVKAFINDVELFLDEELDFDSFDMSNVSFYDFKPLAIKFGDRYNLESLSSGNNNGLVILGWKSIRVILMEVIRIELKKLEQSEAQILILVIEKFIRSFSIMQGESAEIVLDKLRFWEIFKDYEFSLEADGVEKSILKSDPAPIEHIVWTNEEYTYQQFGLDLEEKYKLIVDANQWNSFFENPMQKIGVAKGKLNQFISVLTELRYKGIIGKSMGNGFWKILQETLVDMQGNNYKPELRKISSRIRKRKNQTDKDNNDFGLSVVETLSNKK